MKLVQAPEYGTQTITPPTSDTAPVSEIVVAGLATGKFVGGAIFEAALKWHEHVLLFLTDDVPFEEGLNIYLLDANLEVVDEAHMYHMYASGVFSDLDLTQSDSIRFCFFGSGAYTLTLFPQKRFMLPVISDPIGVHRPFRFYRRFKISSRPLPETV
ncbi:hypothetical protein GJ699_30550 [Duganella sp. FT80W]|uniref:Uncharacterized protein n=1 Tax=Duganella guangzhouensis TaxID=2666084 RepID=A0A6I2LBY8_9BURK|nr:hypothetical protein [Duganella guangzhouensis]MRW94324.1 hypothetical protein [Duganella guangzhouensis]